jgi:hypothetical protein
MFTAQRQQILNTVSSLARFLSGDCVATLARGHAGELVVRAITVDGDAGAEQTVDGVRASGEQITTSLRALEGVAKFAEGDCLKIHGSDDHAVLTSNRAEFRLTLADVEDSPQPPTLPTTGTEVKLGSCLLAGLVSRTRFAARARSDDAPWATDAFAVRAERQGLALGATDTICAATARVTAESSGAASLLLPTRVVARWATALHAYDASTLRLTPDFAILQCNDVSAWARATSGSHPPDDSLEFPASHTVPFPPPLRALLALSQAGDDATFTIRRNSIELTTPAGSAKVPLASAHKGPQADIPLDGHRLAKAILAYSRLGLPVSFGYSHANRPVVITAGNARFTLAPRLLQTEVQAA